MDLINRVFKEYLDCIVIVFINDTLMCSSSIKEHKIHLKIILQRLQEKQLYAKLSKCDFWQTQVGFLGHIVSREGISIDPEKTKIVV